MMYILYWVLVSLAAPIAAGWLFINPKHRRLLERFRPAVPSLTRAPIWVHACSVGEVQTARPILLAIEQRWPGSTVLLTVSTLSGYELAASWGGKVRFTWFPFDHPLAVKRFLAKLNPRLLVLIETELWPAVLNETRRRGVPIAVVNGRLSDKHYARYRRWRPFLGFMFRPLSIAAMQNDEYARRIADLGAPAVHVTGNTKFDGARTQRDPAVEGALRHENGFSETGRILLFGSTRPGDEALAAACWTVLREKFPDLHLVIAPRHTGRLSEALAPFDEPILRRSQVKSGQTPNHERVFCLDTTGELAGFYALASVAVIGGSFYPGVEGHNPIEPAALGVPTVFGPYMRNFDLPARALIEAGGARQAASPEALCTVLEDLLDSEASRTLIGERGREVVLANQGAIDRTLDLLENLIA